MDCGQGRGQLANRRLTGITSRRYRTDDLLACLAIFNGNVPEFFAPEERAEFHDFLNEIKVHDDLYLVLTQAGRVIACGGLTIDRHARQAILAWGMVDRAHHGQGIGTQLTQARMAQAWADPRIDRVVLATSQHTQGFYAGFGFAVTQITPNGFGAGLDRWDMSLNLLPPR